MQKRIVGSRRLQQLAKREAENCIVSIAAHQSLIDSPITSEPEPSSLPSINFSPPSSCDNTCKSSDSDSSSNNESTPKDIIQDLRNWALTEDVNHKQLSSLLKVLKKHPCFEDIRVDARSVLAKPHIPKAIELTPGEYVHFGLEKQVNQVIESHSPKTVEIQINIDGLPLFKSSKIQFWPILCRIIKYEEEPFAIGVYCGTKKPAVNDYLKYFVEEFNQLKEKLRAKSVILKTHSYVCDAPAKAYIKCIKGHTGYHGCDKCVLEGDYICNRVVFKGTALHRTDISFRQKQDEDHHLSTSLLENVTDLDMIKDFPLDYMHCICLGATRKLINLWLKGKPGPNKLSALKINALSSRLVSLKAHIANDFSRKPRPLDELDRWKATEFRQFLLYTGPVILKGIISDDNYLLFMSLSVAVRILCSKDLCQIYNSYANDLLNYFVQSSEKLYGPEFISYNIHGLLHISDDVKRFGVLDNFSAFPFENKLGQLKNLIRTPHKPLQQLSARLLEKSTCKPTKKVQKLKLGKGHLSGPVLIDFECDQYTSLELEQYAVNIKNKADSYLLTKTGEVAFVKNICVDNETKSLSQPYFLVNKLQGKRSLFEKPCSSILVGIQLVDPPSEESELCKVSIAELKCKCQVFDLDQGLAVLPLLH